MYMNSSQLINTFIKGHFTSGCNYISYILLSNPLRQYSTDAPKDNPFKRTWFIILFTII